MRLEGGVPILRIFDVARAREGLGEGPVGGDSVCLLDPFGNTLRIEEVAEKDG
jgi:hypothetical protein